MGGALLRKEQDMVYAMTKRDWTHECTSQGLEG